MMRQLVGAPIQLAIAQRLFIAHQGRGLRRALHLGLKQLLQTVLTWVLAAGGIPLLQLLYFGCR